MLRVPISIDQGGAEQLLGCGANLNRHSGRSRKLLRTSNSSQRLPSLDDLVGLCKKHRPALRGGEPCKFDLADVPRRFSARYSQDVSVELLITAHPAASTGD